MQLRNKSARVLYLRTPSGLLQLPPLGTVELSGEQADAATVALTGAFAPMVADGSLEVDGAAPQPRGAVNASLPSESSVTADDATPKTSTATQAASQPASRTPQRRRQG